MGDLLAFSLFIVLLNKNLCVLNLGCASRLMAINPFGKDYGYTDGSF